MTVKRRCHRVLTLGLISAFAQSIGVDPAFRRTASVTTLRKSCRGLVAAIAGLAICPQSAGAAVEVIDPPAGYLYVTPVAISPDGSKVAVLLEDGSGNTVVNLWTANDGFQPLLLPGYPFSTGYRVSNDFSVVVSAGYGNGSSSAFVWSATEGLQAIEPLTGDQTTAWEAVSADGSTVLGKSRTSSVPFTERDFVWTPSLAARGSAFGNARTDTSGRASSDARTLGVQRRIDLGEVRHAEHLQSKN